MKALYFCMALTAVGIINSCVTGDKRADAYGNFEAVEITVSSENSGTIIHFALEEGALLKAGEIAGLIDTVQLSLKKEQLQAAIQALYAKVPEVDPQINVLTEQLATAREEKLRFEKLVMSGAANAKQLDDINAGIKLTERKIAATRSTLNTQSRGILAEAEPLKAQIRQLVDLIEKSLIKNPIEGTVLSKFAEAGEMTTAGKPLYTIADISRIILRAYFSGEQLSQVKLGQKVRVMIDAPGGKYREYAGIVTWVADKAEFTPKIVQTKDERVNLVYAVKVLVHNDGAIKIGMPGEVWISAKGD